MQPSILLCSLMLVCCDTSPLTSLSASSSLKANSTSPQYKKLSYQGTTLHYLTFSTKHHRIEVADQPDGPGSKWSDAKSAAKAHNALIAINAGFFTPEGKPLGLCIDNGVKTGGINHSSLGSGAFVSPSSGNPKLIRRSAISQHQNATHLLQTGPFLIDRKKPIKVKASPPRPRCFIAWDGNHQWLIGHVEKITLPDLVDLLDSASIPNFSIHSALNLDGGRSSQLYFDNSITGKEKQFTTFLNRKVRNFLIIKKK